MFEFEILYLNRFFLFLYMCNLYVFHFKEIMYNSTLIEKMFLTLHYTHPRWVGVYGLNVKLVGSKNPRNI